MTVEALPATTGETEHQTPLPRGWRLAELGEVCDFLDHRRRPISSEERNKRIAGKKQNELYPYYGANGQTGWIDGYIFDEPLILLAEDGGNFGSMTRTIAYKVTGKYWVNNHAHVLRPKRDVDLDYLKFSLSIRPDIADLVAGATRAKLNLETASTLTIVLPPTIEEQKRIASVLNEQMEAVEQTRRAVEEQLKAAKLLRSALLRSVFESESAQSWQKRKLGVLTRVQSGYAFKTDWYVKDGVRLLRNANVFQGYIDWSDVVKLSLDARSEYKSYELDEGDVILSLDRPLVSNGLKVAKLTSEDVPSLLVQRVGRFLLKEGLDSEYLYLFLNANNFINSIKGHDQSLGVPHISPTQVENIEIPVPAVEKQKQIARNLNEQMQKVESLKKHLFDQLEAIKKMPSALLRKAFAGQV